MNEFSHFPFIFEFEFKLPKKSISQINKIIKSRNKFQVEIVLMQTIE